MTQTEAFLYFLFHMVHRHDPAGKEAITRLSHKRVGIRSILNMDYENSYRAYNKIRFNLRGDDTLISWHLSSFIFDPQARLSTFIHCAELVVGNNEFPIKELEHLKIVGETLGFDSDKMDLILHFILARQHANVMHLGEMIN